MSKLTNIVTKSKLWSILLGFVLLAGLVIGIFFGFNTASVMKDATTLTVSTDRYTYTKYEDDLKKECEAIFESKNVQYSSPMKGETSGNEYELVYVFDKDTNLDEVKTALKEVIATKTAANGAWDGSFIDVMSAKEEVKAVTADGYALRGAIACAIMLVFAIAYVALRYRWDMGLLVGIAMALAFFLTSALIAISRVLVTNSIAYVVILSGLLSAVMTLFTLNNIREKKADATAESIAENIAVKEVLMLAIATVIALVALMVAGFIANKMLVGFALASVLGLISATVISVVYAPSIYLPLKKTADKKEVEKDKHYVGAKAKDEE